MPHKKRASSSHTRFIEVTAMEVCSIALLLAMITWITRGKMQNLSEMFTEQLLSLWSMKLHSLFATVCTHQPIQINSEFK